LIADIRTRERNELALVKFEKWHAPPARELTRRMRVPPKGLAVSRHQLIVSQEAWNVRQEIAWLLTPGAINGIARLRIALRLRGVERASWRSV
jgi:hypothetical protein